jgi:hypothetical protein
MAHWHAVAVILAASLSVEQSRQSSFVPASNSQLIMRTCDGPQPKCIKDLAQTGTSVEDGTSRLATCKLLNN